MAAGVKRGARLRSLGSPSATSTAAKRKPTKAKTPVSSAVPAPPPVKVVKKRKTESPCSSSALSTAAKRKTTKAKTPLVSAVPFPAPVKVVKKRKTVSASPRPVEPKEYEVQCIRSHQIDTRTHKVMYYTKWQGFTEVYNTYEVESNFCNSLTVYKYWTSVLNGGKESNENKKDYAASALIQHEWQHECIRFNVDQTLFYKKLIDSDMVKKYDWSNYSLSFHARSKMKELAIDQYNSTLGMLTRLCSFYPDIQLSNVYDRFMPMAMHNFLPFSVRKDMIFMEREKESDPKEFTGNHLSERNLMRALRILKALQTKEMNPVKITETGILCEEIRMQAVFDPNSLKSDTTAIQRLPKLELCRTEDKTWALITLREINEGDIIMPITGEVVDISEAEKCFREEGEMVAFKHFLALPKRTNLCLDRRRRSDHSRYLQHSCEPNCVVRSVVFESNKIPQSQCIPVLYLMAKETIPARTVLTLDFFLNLPLPDTFKGTTKADESIRAEFSEKSRDHIWCTCDADSSVCRGLLWVEDIEGDVYTLSKMEKLEKTRIDGSTVFRGLDVRSPE